ncbi:deoxycytidylate deaminase [Flammeovirga agarivorans]|uniref:dCMP deaminase family protein n=1 Tax=Flammeovirga agarivorans TaxID=2726742 RepID=A0A7X8SPX4_9BACT|nr:dCMP deaminase family protein [Flammeovirga agarivorans]NLR94230.1 dCMP deaminase family protein [Flammeovirga agarivorans]
MSRGQEFDIAFMRCAESIAELSRCVRLKVGAIIVKNGNIISMGYNGTPKGFDNACEFELESSNEETGEKTVVLKTKEEVLHAEANAITKAAKSTYSTDGASIYCTDSCCFGCAKLIIQAGIVKFYYKREYRDTSGLDLLRKAGIEVIKVTY